LLSTSPSTSGEDTDAALLNAAGITTLVRFAGGYRYWGNRTCSSEPLYAFESVVRTSQVLADEIAQGLAWASDKPMTIHLVKDVIETINARIRTYVTQGRLIGGACWYDPALNAEADLAAGKAVLDYDFTGVAPLEGLELNQRVTARYYADFASQLAS
jgi:phage tail sheath protein FI